MTLRPYQKEAVLALRENKKGIIAAATGSGKTTMMAASIKEKAVHGKILVLVHLQDLVVQTAKRIKSETGLKVSLYYGLKKDDYTNADVIVATWQSFLEITSSNSISPDYFYSINVDEAHHARADQYQKVINHFTPSYLHGFTATPYGPGQDIIFYTFGEVIFSIDIFELIEKGYLSKMHMNVFLTNGKSLDELKTTEYNQKKSEKIKEMEAKLHKENRIPKIVHFFRNSKSIEQFEDDTCLQSASSYTSNISYKKKKNILETFKEESENLNHLYTMRMLNEGIDIPIINGLVFHESAGNFRTFTQRLGRGIRVYKDPNAITYMNQFIDENDNDSINSFSSFEQEVKQALIRKGKFEKDFSDFIIIDYDKGTEDFLDDYRKRMEEMSESSALVGCVCPDCGKKFFVLKSLIKKLRKDDSYICTDCGSGNMVKTICAKCETPTYVHPSIYNQRIKGNLSIYCNSHTKKQNPPVIKTCAHCKKEFPIPHGHFKRKVEKGQKVFLCSRECKSEYAKVTVKCHSCGMDFIVRKGDYSVVIKKGGKCRLAN